MATGGYNWLPFNFRPMTGSLKMIPPTIKPRDLVKLINGTEKGEMLIGDLFAYYCGNQDLILKILIENSGNFKILTKSENDSQFTGEEKVCVFTNLALCSYHCKLGKDGRNKTCDGQCGALHLCRNFLLKSERDCRFSARGNCMFGHDFRSKHNSALLKEHNLDALTPDEIRNLFRLPLSRCKTTVPQICKYYNNDKMCTNKRCTSLHICSQWVFREIHINCAKNHSFSDAQVRKALSFFHMGENWPMQVVCDLVFQFNKRTDSSGEIKSNYSETDSESDEISDVESLSSMRSSTSTDHNIFNARTGHQEMHNTCSDCKNLAKEINLMKQEIDELKLEVKNLKRQISK